MHCLSQCAVREALSWIVNNVKLYRSSSLFVLSHVLLNECITGNFPHLIRHLSILQKHHQSSEIFIPSPRNAHKRGTEIREELGPHYYTDVIYILIVPIGKSAVHTAKKRTTFPSHPPSLFNITTSYLSFIEFPGQLQTSGNAMISRIPLSARSACRHAYSSSSRLRSTTGLVSFAQQSQKQPSISQLSFSARSFSSTTRNSFKQTFPRQDEPSQQEILEQQARSGVNPPYTTRPPPLNLPERQPDASTFSHLFATGKAYLTFYKTGLRQVITNYKVLRAVGQGGEGPIGRSENPVADPNCIDGYLRFRTRGSLQLYKRIKHDFQKLPIFALMLLICGEFTPFVVLAVPTIVPYTCRIPKQVDKILKRVEDRRAQALDSLVGEVYEEDDYHQVPETSPDEIKGEGLEEKDVEIRVSEVTPDDLAAWRAHVQQMTPEEKEQYEAEIDACEDFIKSQREEQLAAAQKEGKEVEADPRSPREQAQEWVDLARADHLKYGSDESVQKRKKLDVFPMTAEEALEHLDPLSEDCEQFNMLDVLARTYDVSSWLGPAGRERNVHKHLRFLAVDTELLEQDGGVQALEDEEVVLACIERGIDVREREIGDLRYALEKWIILTTVMARNREDSLRRMVVLGTCEEILWPGIPWPERFGEALEAAEAEVVEKKEGSVEAEEKEKVEDKAEEKVKEKNE